MDRNVFNFRIAFESVLVNKLRGILTALGIVFGVAAVIAMLAIGSGAKKFILDQMKLDEESAREYFAGRGAESST